VVHCCTMNKSPRAPSPSPNKTPTPSSASSPPHHETAPQSKMVLGVVYQPKDEKSGTSPSASPRKDGPTVKIDLNNLTLPSQLSEFHLQEQLGIDGKPLPPCPIPLRVKWFSTNSAPDKFTLIRFLRAGQSGSCYLAECKSVPPETKGQSSFERTVLIKQINSLDGGGAPTLEVLKTTKEYKVLEILQKNPCPYTCLFLGSFTGPYINRKTTTFSGPETRAMLVMDLYAENLETRLTEMENAIVNAQKNEFVVTLLQYCVEIGRGLSHLWKNKIVHCDLKPDNICFSQNGQHLVLVDYGNSVVVNDAGECNLSETNIANSVSWSPEFYGWERKNAKQKKTTTIAYFKYKQTTFLGIRDTVSPYCDILQSGITRGCGRHRSS